MMTFIVLTEKGEAMSEVRPIDANALKESHYNYATGELEPLTWTDIDLAPTIEPCEDAISRADAVEIAYAYCPDDDGSCTKGDRDIRELLDDLEALPSVAPSRPSGEWMNKGDYAICSVCGGYSGTQFDGMEPIPRTTKYYPHCGAKMKGVDNG